MGSIQKDKRRVAIFDVDGTIFRSSLLIEITEALIDEEIFSKELRSQYRDSYSDWVNRKGSYEDYIGDVVEVFVGNLKGVLYKDFVGVAEKVVEEKAKRTYIYTRELIGDLKEGGFYLLAISQSPKTILDDFCTTLGFDKVYGRLYETGATGRFTGNVVDEHLIANKANIVKRAVEKEGLTLEGSVGVGDTEGDIAFLDLVERPICFNPNKKLYKYAKVKGWKIVVERKNVVYEIS